MNTEIQNYHQQFEAEHAQICTTLATIITANISQSEGKIWHGHPVWFIDGNPIVGYSKQKPGIRLMFWSGADFDEAELHKAFDWFSQRERRFGRTSAQVASETLSASA